MSRVERVGGMEGASETSRKQTEEECVWVCWGTGTRGRDPGALGEGNEREETGV